MIYFNIFLIACILVIITDLTDFFETVKHFVWRFAWGNRPYKQFSIKPLGCSLCETFWGSLIYILAIGEFNLMVLFYIVFIAYMTPVIMNVFLLIKEFFIKFIDWWYNILRLE